MGNEELGSIWVSLQRVLCMLILDVFFQAVFARERCASGTIVAMMAYRIMSIDMPREVPSLY